MAEEKSMTDTLKEKASSLFSSIRELGNSAKETLVDKAEQGKEAIEERMREREANEIYRQLGKKIYRLYKRNELTLPESCEKYAEKLDDLYGENEPDESCEMNACSENKECCGDKECSCENKEGENKENDDDKKDA